MSAIRKDPVGAKHGQINAFDGIVRARYFISEVGSLQNYQKIFTFVITLSVFAQFRLISLQKF